MKKLEWWWYGHKFLAKLHRIFIKKQDLADIPKLAILQTAEMCVSFFAPYTLPISWQLLSSPPIQLLLASNKLPTHSTNGTLLSLMMITLYMPLVWSRFLIAIDPSLYLIISGSGSAHGFQLYHLCSALVWHHEQRSCI